MITLIVCGAVLIVIFTNCWIIIPAYMGRLIQDPLFFKKRVRPLGPGFHWLWPWEISVEDSDTDLVTLSHDFQITLEAGSKKTENKAESKEKEIQKTDNEEEKEGQGGQGEPVPLNCNFTTFPSVKDLVQFRKFKKDERIKAIKENLKSFLTSIQKNYKNRQDMMEKTAEITEQVKNFINNETIAINNDEIPTSTMNMREYYGVSIPLFIIGDVEQPQELQKAIIQKEAVRQQNIAKTLEMNNVRKRANAMVSDSTSKLDYEKAIKIVQMQDGKNIKEEKRIFGVEPGTLDPIKEVVKEAVKEAIIYVLGKKRRR